MLLTSWLRSLRTNRFRKHSLHRKTAQKRNRLQHLRFSSQAESLEDRTLLTALIFDSEDPSSGTGLQIDNNLVIGTGTSFSPEFDSVVIESVNTDSAGIDITLNDLFLNTIVIDTVNVSGGGTVNINLDNISGLQSITLDNLNVSGAASPSVVVTVNDMVIDDVSIFGSSFDGLDFNLNDSSAVDAVDSQVNNFLISKSSLSDVDVVLDGTAIQNGRIVENTLTGSTDSESLSLILINGANADGFSIDNNVELEGISINAISSSFDDAEISGNVVSGPVGVEGIFLSLRNGATADRFTVAENLGIESITEDAVHFDLDGTPIDGLTIRDNEFSRGVNTGIDFLIDGDTFSQPFAITNTSGLGQRLVRFRLDIAPSGLEFDPTAETGQPFTPVNGSETVTGLVEPVDVLDRSTLLDMRFTDFTQNETFQWLLDLDRAGLDTSVLGNELIGSTVVLDFSDGTQVTGVMVAVPDNPDASRLAIAQGGSGGDGVDFNLDHADLTNLDISGNFLEGNADSGFRFTAFHSNIDAQIVGNELNLMSDHGLNFDLVSSNFSGAIFQNTIGGNGGNAINFAPRVENSGLVLGASNQDPIRITSFAHGLTSGDVVTIVGVEGNEAANGTFTVNVVSANVFELVGVEGDGLYLGGGSWYETQDAITIDLQSSSSKGLSGNVLNANAGSGIFVDLPVGTTLNANITRNVVENNQDVGFALIAKDSVFDLNVGSVNSADGNLFNRNVGAGIGFDINDTAVGSYEIRNNEIIGTLGSAPSGPVGPRYDIDLSIVGGLSPSQIAIFDLAASRWEEMIIGDLPDVGLIDDVLISAQGAAIDGPGGILGFAGPTGLRPAPSFLPFSGDMTFDTADLDQLEASGQLQEVILHEMAHVIGFGTIWTRKGLLSGAGSNDPRFTGPQATAEYNQIFGNSDPDVPVANTGGRGTRDAHWREATFGNELLTGFINPGFNPVSRITVAQWADLGYVVDLDAADPYTPPGGFQGPPPGGGGGGGNPPPSHLVLPPGASLVGDGINITLSGSDPTAAGKPRLIRSVIDGNIIGKDAQGNTGRGIAFFMQEKSVIDDLVISNNTFINNGSNGFEFSRRDDAELNAVIVEHNSFQGNVGNGIDLFAKNTTLDLLNFQLTENDLTLNGSNGINVRVEAEARIEANFDLNVIDRNGGSGIQFGGFQQVDIVANMNDNVIRNNGSDGIRNIGDGTMALIGTWNDNLVETNDDVGVSISGAVFGDMTWNRNMIRENGSDGVQFLGPAGIFVQWNGNTVADNDGHGVFVDSRNQDDGGIRFILGDLDPININTISGNNGDGIRIYGSRNYLDSRNNIIANNTGKGVDIQADMGFLNDNFTDQQISRFLFKETTIFGNGDDGIEFRNDATETLLDIRDSFIRFNGGRGIDILNQAYTNNFGAGTSGGSRQVTTISNINILDSVINSNSNSGIYVVNTADHNQTQNSNNDTLTRNGHILSAPFINIRIRNNRIESNGSIDSGIPGGSTLGGLVFRVGTADSDFRFFSNDISRNVLARIRAEVVNNAFAGNFGAEVFIDNFVSTVDPPTTTGTWGATPDPTVITQHLADPLSRMDLVFRGNSGDTLDVTNGNAFYNNDEQNFKSRRVDKNVPGPFTSGTRPRNATRLPGLISAPMWLFAGVGDSTLRVESNWESDNFTLKQGFGFSDFDSFWLGTPAVTYTWDATQLSPGDVFGTAALPDVFDSAGQSNDSWFDASDLGELGSIQIDNLNIDVPMEEDWYKFTVTQSGLVTVGTTGTGDLDLGIVDSEGRTIDRSTTGGSNEQAVAFVEPGRTYYVRAYPAGDRTPTVGNYSLTINAPGILPPGPPVNPPSPPPNNTPDMPVLGTPPNPGTPPPLTGPILVDFFGADSQDADAFDGVAEDAGGNTSLRAAIMQANASPNGANPDVIQIDAGTVLFTQLGQDENNAMFGDLDITDDVVITGAGIGETFIDANDLDRVFHILPGVNVTISGMTITNGSEGHGGAIFNQGTLDLSEVSISNNDASVQGGAIFNEGTLNLNNATLDGNFADSRGGGLFNAGGTVDVQNSTFSNNTASSRGGGIFNDGDLRIVNSTISGNSTVTNGGGIFNNGDLEVINVTITLNHTSVAGGGIANDPSAVIQIANTIVSGNMSDTSHDDVFGSFGSLGSNFIGDVDTAEGFIDGVIGDQVGGNGNPVIDAGLSALGDFGGFSPTHFPNTDSPVRDRGSNTVATEFLTDQRGNVRVFDGDKDGSAVVDIGAVEAAEISHGGLIFEDTNGDGIRQQTETGKSGVTISLFSAGSDGVFGGGDDVLLGTTQTDANGLYLFEEIIPGKFYLSVVVPTGFDLSPQDQGGNNSVDSDFNPLTGRTPVFPLSGSFQDEVQDAGLIPQPASFGDFVFSDLDENGMQVVGEPGIEGIEVTLFSPGADGQIGGGDDVLLGMTTTNVNGIYGFGGLVAGDYYLSFGAKAGFAVTQKDVGNDDNLDSDVEPTTGITDLFTLVPGQNNTSVDAGYVPGAKVGNSAWLDTNNDGIRQPSEAGVADVLVELFTAGPDGQIGGGDDLPAGITTTDSLGNYQFQDLLSGEYYIRFTTPTALAITARDQGTNDNLDSDVNPFTGLTDVFTLFTGQNDDSIDIGLINEARVGNFVWKDLNRNGIQDAGESGLSGLEVRISTAGADGEIGGGDDLLLQTTTTDSQGQYTFGNLPPGRYFVEFEEPPTLNFTTPDVLPGPGGNDNIDSDVNPQTRMTEVFTLTDGQFDQSIDAGLVDESLIGNFVFSDLNNDGIQQISEPGVEGAQITLFSAGADGLIGGGDDTELATTFSDSNGRYLFTELDAGSFYARFSAPAGSALTSQVVGNNRAVDSDPNPQSGLTPVFELADGQFLETVDAGVVPGSTIGDFVWFDSNQDGRQQVGENGAENVLVNLFITGNDGVIGGGDDIFIAMTTTDASGRYSFVDLPSDRYYLTFGEPDQFIFTLPNQGVNDLADSDVDFSGLTDAFDIVTGQVDVSHDAGLIPHTDARVGNFAFRDINGDGLQQAEDFGFAGLQVSLFNAGSDGEIGGADDILVKTTTTNAKGRYVFNNLAPGAYFIGIETPVNITFTQQFADNDAASTVDSNIDPFSGLTNVFILDAGENDQSVDAGLIDDTSVGDFVFRDTSRDGIRQASELGIPGVIIDIISTGPDGQIGGGDDTLVASTTTDANGEYLFTNLTPGDYFLQFTSPNFDLDFTLQNQGVDDTLDSNVDPATGRTEVLTLNSGTNLTSVDAGMIDVTRVGNFVWRDTNQDGIQQENEPGEEGVEVKLFSAGADGVFGGGDDSEVASTLTDANGNFMFRRFDEGNYFLFFVAPPGKQFTSLTQGNDDNLDSDADPSTGRTDVFHIAEGQADVTRDAGLVSQALNPTPPDVPFLTGPPATISDTTPLFTWNTSNGADTYELLVYNVALGQEALNQSGIVGTSFESNVTFVPGTHQAFLRATNAFGTSNWSPARFFEVIPSGTSAPGRPTLTGPASPTTDTTPTFTWNAVAVADTYELLVYNVSQGRQVINQAGIVGTSHTDSTVLQAGEHQAFLRATNSVGTSVWSVPHFFTVAPGVQQGPGKPTFTSPADGSQVNDLTPTFTWTTASNADNYELWIFDIQAGQQVRSIQNITATSFTLTNDLTQGRSYQAFVRAHNSFGTGAWSDPIQFMVVSADVDHFENTTEDLLDPAVGPNLAVPHESELQISESQQNLVATLTTRQFDPTMEVYDVVTESSPRIGEYSVEADNQSLATHDEIDSILGDWNEMEWWKEEASQAQLIESSKVTKSQGSVKAAISSGFAVLGLKTLLERRRGNKRDEK